MLARWLWLLIEAFGQSLGTDKGSLSVDDVVRSNGCQADVRVSCVAADAIGVGGRRAYLLSSWLGQICSKRDKVVEQIGRTEREDGRAEDMGRRSNPDCAVATCIRRFRQRPRLSRAWSVAVPGRQDYGMTARRLNGVPGRTEGPMGAVCSSCEPDVLTGACSSRGMHALYGPVWGGPGGFCVVRFA